VQPTLGGHRNVARVAPIFGPTSPDVPIFGGSLDEGGHLVSTKPDDDTYTLWIDRPLRDGSNDNADNLCEASIEQIVAFAKEQE
jgi:hypothetical protein